MAGCVPSEHEALGSIPSPGTNQMGWHRSVTPALGRCSYLPEVTHRMRSWERSQRALPWVPLPFPPHCSLVPVVSTGSSGAGDQKEQEEKWRKCRREAETGTPAWGSELEARAWEGIKGLGGHVCLAAQDYARRSADSDPWGHPFLSPQALSRSLETIKAWLSVSQGLRGEGHRPQEVVAPGL